VAVVTDIDERKRMEQALRDGERRLGAELDAMTRLHALSTRLLSAGDLSAALDDALENVILACSADFGNLQLINPQTGDLEIVVQRGFGQDFLDHFRAVRVEDGSACARAMLCGERVIVEDVLLDPDFEPHRAVAAAAGFRAVQSTPLRTHDGRVLGMISTHFRQPHRVSDRDQRLLDLYARYAADLIERIRTEEALKEADRHKDEFLALLGHELRNPLAPIRNAVNMLRLQSAGDPTVARMLPLMERQLATLVRLVDDLLDVSRISRGKIELRKEAVDLTALAARVVEAARPAMDEYGHRFEAELPADPVWAEADPARVEQVLSNLLSNAGRYTPRGGYVRLSLSREGSEAVVRVRDTGIGIRTEDLPAVWETFRQASRVEGRVSEGLGLGLTLVRRLTELHGGTVGVASEGHGKGSEFVLRLPALPADSRHEAVPAAPAPSEPGAGLRVLVVDDNRDAAESLAMVLELAGYEVRTAGDGERALAVAREFRPEAVLLDISMPGALDGYAVARRLRQDPGMEGALLVAITGYGTPEDVARARDAGFDSHLAKPADPAQVKDLLAARRVGGANG
jgi:signal transduction histidine kinase/ActR/RegA family two-component response regulator